MNAATIQEKKKFNPLVAHITTSLLVTSLLCYIDEGYYNFEWTKDASNWFFFFIIAFFIVLGQTISDKWIFKKFDDQGKLIITSLIGIPIGFLLYLAAIFAIGSIFHFLVYNGKS